MQVSEAISSFHSHLTQIPVNCPLNPVHTRTQDGLMCVQNRGYIANYAPNGLGDQDPHEAGEGVAFTPFPVQGNARRHGWKGVDLEIDMVQPRLLWESVFSADDRKECAQNLAISLSNVRPEILERQMALLEACSPEIAHAVRAALEIMPSPPASNIMQEPSTLASKQSPVGESLLLSLAGGVLRGAGLV